MPATPQQTSQARKWMKQQVELAPELYTDCGEVDATKLGEEATTHFDLGEGDEQTTPDWVWDLAAEVAAEIDDKDKDSDAYALYSKSDDEGGEE